MRVSVMNAGGSSLIGLDDVVPLQDAHGASYRVRRLRRRDRSLLQTFNRALGADRRLFIPHAYDDRTVGGMLKRSEDGEDLALGLFPADRQEDHLLGGYFFLWYVRERVPLLGIGMLRAYQGAGLGSRMVNLLVEQAMQAGCEGVDLTTLPDNHRAFALYEKCGFHYYGDVKNVDGNGRTVIERAMFREIVPGARPPDKPHGPPPLK